MFSNNEVITHRVDANRAGYFILKLCELKGQRRLDPKLRSNRMALKKPTCVIDLVYEDFSGVPKQQVLKFAPMGDVRTTLFFVVQDVKSGDIFIINRKTYMDLVAPIRYVR